MTPEEHEDRPFEGKLSLPRSPVGLVLTAWDNADFSESHQARLTEGLAESGLGTLLAGPPGDGHPETLPSRLAEYARWARHASETRRLPLALFHVSRLGRGLPSLLKSVGPGVVAVTCWTLHPSAGDLLPCNCTVPLLHLSSASILGRSQGEPFTAAGPELSFPPGLLVVNKVGRLTGEWFHYYLSRAGKKAFSPSKVVGAGSA